MESRRRLRSFSALGLSSVMTLGSMLSPTAAKAECIQDSVDSVTVTVGTKEITTPEIAAQVCAEATGGGVPRPTVTPVTAGGGCAVGCLALIVGISHMPTGVEAVAVVTIDGHPRWVRAAPTLPVGDQNPCVFGLGFPNPPVSGCAVSLAPQ